MWSFQESIKMILMGTPNNGEHIVSTGYLLSPCQASSGKTGLLSIELLTKGVQWKLPNNPCFCWDEGLLSPNWEYGPIAENNIHTAHWAQRKGADAYIQPSFLYSNLFCARWYPAGYWKRNMDTKPYTKSWAAICPACNYARTMVELVGEANKHLVWVKAALCGKREYKWESPLTPSSQSSRNPPEEEAKDCKRQRG